ncbi:haloacid dehalogenase superfamily, subfamily IA, variant 3 with third motif having DD or ED [Alkalitalea saponilacus]|uniref:Haloacid dehalogenase superfamily, subfamily IA, variant 3 with third motif having DD or ED n=2 Tax=Alkalitalea saponilacus TaxID=889453 RepID=A0A1T5F647_9BACT|nr:haloacid dehalogenase superfamily, subfamily IA, variant 3 with third motif having DD or ED [Alkalitalea saponilacus]
MDGVLYDSMPNHASTWVESFRRSGINFPEYDAYLNEGRTGPATINIAFEKCGNRQATEDDIKTIYDTKTELMQAAPEAPIMPGMKEVVRKTIEAGLKVVVVTGSRQPSLLARLESDYGISRDNVINGFDVKRGKPDPEPYLMALKKANCKASDAIVIENAPMGVESSVKAGIITIAVNTGILKPEVLSDSGASVVLPGTEELLKHWGEVTDSAINR